MTGEGKDNGRKQAPPSLLPPPAVRPALDHWAHPRSEPLWEGVAGVVECGRGKRCLRSNRVRARGGVGGRVLLERESWAAAVGALHVGRAGGRVGKGSLAPPGRRKFRGRRRGKEQKGGRGVGERRVEEEGDGGGCGPQRVGVEEWCPSGDPGPGCCSSRTGGDPWDA